MADADMPSGYENRHRSAAWHRAKAEEYASVASYFTGDLEDGATIPSRLPVTQQTLLGLGLLHAAIAAIPQERIEVRLREPEPLSAEELAVALSEAAEPVLEDPNVVMVPIIDPARLAALADVQRDVRDVRDEVMSQGLHLAVESIEPDERPDGEESPAQHARKIARHFERPNAGTAEGAPYAVEIQDGIGVGQFVIGLRYPNAQWQQIARGMAAPVAYVMAIALADVLHVPFDLAAAAPEVARRESKANQGAVGGDGIRW